MKKLLLLALLVTLCLPGFISAAEKKDPLAAWKPKFDPSGAEFTYILSNISHPVIEGVAAGYRIRDKVWEKSGGRIYVDYRPLAQLGGEKDVMLNTPESAKRLKELLPNATIKVLEEEGHNLIGLSELVLSLL